MSESGQPGAATPGEHGDGTGQQDDLARTGNGWAPSSAGWARSGETGGSREPAPSWRQPDPTLGWGASSPRHGDLPPALPGLPADTPPTRTNGRRVNGFGRSAAEPPADRPAPVSAPPGRVTPVSAPPGLLGEPRRDSDGDRLVVPAQRPAPAVEQPAPPHGLAEPEPGPARHASDDPPGRPTRWAEPGPPTSAPPAVQVPPVGTTASGFEVPPGFHAPTADRPETGEPPSAVDPRGWGDPFPPEPSTPEPRPGPAGPDRTAGLDRALTAGDPAGPAAAAPTTDRAPATEPDWSGPNWNRPSWGSGWAPSWAREEAEPTGRRVREEAEPTGRRARDEPTPGWASEPNRPYEPVRAEPSHPYEPPRPELSRPYEPARAEPEPRPAYEPRTPHEPSAERPAYEPPAERPAYEPPAERPAYQPPAERPSWAGGPPAATPASAPPSYDRGAAESSGATPSPTEGEPRSEPRSNRPFRFRSAEAATATPEPPGDPTPSGPATAPATSGDARRDRTPTAPTPTSAPPYAARRSAPEPVPTAQPADDRLPDRASAVLPQRVPAEPDVPVVPEPPAVEPPAETPELARIATHLRRDDEPAPMRERPEGFDVNAILDAVREVAGVRDAALRRTPAGAHSLRLDLADGADPAEVSRQVARLLQERMGLAAAPQNVPGLPAAPPPPVRRRATEPRAAEPRAAERTVEPRTAEPRGSAPEPRAAEARASTTEPRVPAARTEAGPTRAEQPTEPEATPRRRRQAAGPHRGRATVEEPGSVSAAPAGTATGSPATGASYSGGQVTTTESAPSRPLATGGAPGPRVVIDHVQVSTFGLDATVEVRLIAGGQSAAGYSTGPAVDGYVLRLCAVAAAAAVDELLRGAVSAPERGRCFVEHAAVVPFGNCEVATVVVLLVCDGWVEQLAGSALVAGDPRQAVVRATLAAVNRRLEALLA